MIGAFRRLLTLETAARLDDGCGGFTVSWVASVTVWADVMALAGREALEADRVVASVSHRITLRHLASLLPSAQLRDGTRIYDILAVRDPDGRRRELTCDCVEREAG